MLEVPFCCFPAETLFLRRIISSFAVSHPFLSDFFFFLFGKKLLEYDNFSHWGLIVKILLQKNRFPNFMEENYLMFRNILLEVRRIYIVDAAGVTRPGIF